MAIILMTEGSCSRCGNDVMLRQITDESKFYAWCSRRRTREHPDPTECWATDGLSLQRLHHVKGFPQMLEAVITP